MRKGEQTRTLILNEAVALASQVGLEGLSIGSLADRLTMSKSGLFAHFGSKEELQLLTLKQAQALFLEEVFAPALKQARGLPRLRALFSNWLQWVKRDLPGGAVLSSRHQPSMTIAPARCAICSWRGNANCAARSRKRSASRSTRDISNLTPIPGS